MKKVYEEISARYSTDSRMIVRSMKDQSEIMLAANRCLYAFMESKEL